MARQILPEILLDTFGDDAMSWPEKEISIYTFPSSHQHYTPLQVFDNYYPRCFLEDDSEEFNKKNWFDEPRRWFDEIMYLPSDLAWGRRFRPDEPENPGSKIEMQFSFDREDMFELSCYRNAGDHHWKLSCLWKELCGKEPLSQEQQMSLGWKSLIFTGTGYQMIGLLRALGECPRNLFTALSGSKVLISMNKVKQMNNTGNRFYLDNNESCVLDINLMETFDCGDKMTSELHWFDRNVARDPMFQHGDTFNQHKRKKTVQLVSSFVVSTFAFLGIFFELWSQLSIIQVQPLHKEHHPVSIWHSLLDLLGLMVFVWAVAIMILVGAPFTRMQSAMLIFWAILMHLKSANSITAVFVAILGEGGFGLEKQLPNEGK